eukprot:UN17295
MLELPTVVPREVSKNDFLQVLLIFFIDMSYGHDFLLYAKN